MLRRIHIQNFRSCKDVVIDDLGSVTALVGRNGSGKTNILRAIDGLARLATSTDLSTDYGLGVLSVPSRVTADVECGGVLYRYSCGIEVSESVTKRGEIRQRLFLRESLAVRNSKEQWERILDRHDEEVHLTDRTKPIKIRAATPCLPALNALLQETEEAVEHSRRLLSFLATARYCPIDEANEVSEIESLDFVSADRYQRWLSRYQSTGDPGDSLPMRLLHAHHEQKPKLDELRSLLGSRGLNLLQDIEVADFGQPMGRAEGEPGEEPPMFHSIYFRPSSRLGGAGQRLDYGDLSLGTRRVVRLLATLVLDDGSLLLIEHPEDGIHRGLVRKLIGLLRANADPGQIILSSHSAVVLNELDAQDVRLVSIHRGATRVRALTPKEAATAARFIDEDGTLAEFVESVEE